MGVGEIDGADSGAVTVESAIALCAVVSVLVLSLAAVTSMIDQIRCVDAAREVARLVARGERDRSTEVLDRVGPSRAHLTIRTEGDTIDVQVRAEPLGGLLPGLRVGGSAFAVAEPGALDPRRDGGDSG